MKTLHHIVGSAIGALWLGMLAAVLTPSAGAGHRPGWVDLKQKPPPNAIQPGVPPAFIERGPPISDRPFAKPFTDRSPSLADRPLPPIGGGHPLTPGAPPPLWCHGRWIGAEQAWLGCPAW
jgi:hypothetical protein